MMVCVRGFHCGCRSAKSALFIGTAFFYLLIAQNGSARDIYSLQVAAARSEEMAANFMEQYSGQMSPVFVYTESFPKTDYRFKVFIGQFGSKAEAYSVRALLNVDGLTTAGIVAWSWDGIQLSQNALPMRRVFDQTAGKIPKATEIELGYESKPPLSEESELSLQATSLDNLSDDQLLDRGKFAESDQAIESLEYLIANYSRSALKPSAHLQLARRHIRSGRADDAQAALKASEYGATRAEKSERRKIEAYLVHATASKQDSFKAFVALANATELEPEHRLDAMVRAASLAKAIKDYPTAWQAFSEIEQASNAPKIKAHVAMQKAAMAFELVTAGKSTWDDTRILCLDAEATAGAPLNDLATARLMYAETYFKEKNYSKALDEMKQVRETYPDQRRECITALYWQARCEEMLGSYDQAIQTLQKLDEEPVDETILFKDLPVKAKGLQMQADLNSRLKRSDEARSAASSLRARYPDSSEAKQLPSGL